MILRTRIASDDAYIFPLIPKDEKGLYMWAYNNYSYPLDFDKYVAGIEKLEEESYFMTFCDNEPIGSVNITRKEESVHLRLVVCKRGFGKLMVKRILSYCFNELGVSFVTLKVFKNNPRAIACYTSVGLRFNVEHETYYEMICRKEWFDE